LESSQVDEIILKKQSLVNELLESIDLNAVQVSKLWSPSKFFHSRAKARLSVIGEVEKAVLGLVDKDFNGIELEKCPLHLEIINRIIQILPQAISSGNLTPYDIKKRRGELKNIIILSNSLQSEVILRFVLRSEDLVQEIKKLVPSLQKQIPELKVISVNIQAVPHQIPEGEKEIFLTEEEYIYQSYNGIEFVISPKAFIQVSPETAEALYAKVAAKVEELEIKSLLDLYCGVGGFSLHAASVGAQVKGIEISTQSIKCARLAAARLARTTESQNKINSVSFSSGSVEDLLKTFEAKNLDAIICNPPRRGLGQETIEHILELSPKYLIYSSCSAKTFFKDLEILKSFYKLNEIHPFDMFPLTKHVEILSIFERSN